LHTEDDQSTSFHQQLMIRSFDFNSFNSSVLSNNFSTLGLPSSSSSSSELVLTDALPGQRGAAWFADLVPVRGFRSEFAMNLSAINAEHHDGVAFVIQSEGSQASGVGGAGLGYGDVNALPLRGIAKSIAIEFDTFQDDASSGRDALHDPNANHVSLQARGGGALQNSADHVYSLQQSTAIPPLSGGVHRVIVEYDPTAQLLVYVLPLTGPVLNVSASLIDLPLDSLGRAYVGFTASTSAASGERHAIGNWSFAFLGRADANRTVASGAALSSAVAGVVESFDVQLVDQYGNNYTFDDVQLSVSTANALISSGGLPGLFTVSYNFTDAAIEHVLNVTQNGVVVVSARPTVRPNVIDAQNSVVQWSVASGSTVIAGDSISMYLVTRDRFGNDQVTGGAAVLVDSTTTASDLKNGSYRADVRLTLAGSSAMQIGVSVNGVQLPALAVNVVAAPLNASRTDVISFDTWIATDLNGTVSIDARDSFGNQCPQDQVTLVFSFTPAASSCTGVWLSPIVGVYNCRVAGRYLVGINDAVSGAPIASSPLELQVSPATALNASASRLRNVDDDSVFTAQVGAALFLETFDFDGNRRDTPAADFRLECGAPAPCVAVRVAPEIG
jgi:hypothetical protein